MKKKFKIAAFMALCVLGIFGTTGCSKDKFFGIEEGTSSFDVSYMFDIAQSSEYFNYEMACINFMSEFNSNDTTNMHLYAVVDGKNIYVKKGSSSFKTLLKLQKELIEKYPELEEADDYVKNQIQMIALSNNPVLNDSLKKIMPNHIVRTKGSNGESDARRWLINAENEMNSYHLNGQYEDIDYWQVDIGKWMSRDGGYLWQLESLSSGANAIYRAREVCISVEMETGGLGWSDGTAAFVFNYQGGIGYMYWPHVNGIGTPQPTSDFHIHPSGCLWPSEADMIAWSHDSNSRRHYIFGLDGDFQWFEQQ